MKTFLGCFFGLVLAVTLSVLLGVAASWVLSYFGVRVPWYVCMVGALLLSILFGSRGGGGSS